MKLVAIDPEPVVARYWNGLSQSPGRRTVGVKDWTAFPRLHETNGALRMIAMSVKSNPNRDAISTDSTH
jgi:hypothetical protein